MENGSKWINNDGSCYLYENPYEKMAKKKKPEPPKEVVCDVFQPLTVLDRKHAKLGEGFGPFIGGHGSCNSLFARRTVIKGTGTRLDWHADKASRFYREDGLYFDSISKINLAEPGMSYDSGSFHEPVINNLGWPRWVYPDEAAAWAAHVFEVRDLIFARTDAKTRKLLIGAENIPLLDDALTTIQTRVFGPSGEYSRVQRFLTTCRTRVIKWRCIGGDGDSRRVFAGNWELDRHILSDLFTGLHELVVTRHEAWQDEIKRAREGAHLTKRFEEV
jgi:hypothetical protein